jgi:ABC-type transporter Mla subunit MlaD
MTRKILTIVVSLIISIGLVVLLGVLLYYGVEENPFRPAKKTLTIRFDDATGIHPRSAVTFLGIRVGNVQSVDYDPDPKVPDRTEYPVVVHVRVTRDVMIPSSVQAVLMPTLLGESSVELGLPPSKKRSAIDEPLPDGKEIIGRRATKLDAVLPGIDETLAKMKDLGTQTVDTLANIAVKKDAHNKTQLEELTDSLNSVAKSLNQPGSDSLTNQLGAIVSNLKYATESIRSLVDVQSNREGTVGDVLTQFRKTSDQLDKDALHADSLLREIKSAAESVTRTSNAISDAVVKFNERPLHYLMTTHRTPEPGKPQPSR